MARWLNHNTKELTSGGSLTGGIQYDKDESFWQVQQDETPFVDQAKLDREQAHLKNPMGHKKFATIPDIVAIEIREKHGIDLHDPLVMHDREKMNRFKQIVMRDYKYLVVNKA